MLAVPLVVAKTVMVWNLPGSPNLPFYLCLLFSEAFAKHDQSLCNITYHDHVRHLTRRLRDAPAPCRLTDWARVATNSYRS